MPALYEADQLTTPRQVLENLGADVATIPLHDWIKSRHLDVPVAAYPLVAPRAGYPLGSVFAYCGDLPVLASLHEVEPVRADRPSPPGKFRPRPVAPLYIVVQDGALSLAMGAV